MPKEAFDYLPPEIQDLKSSTFTGDTIKENKHHQDNELLTIGLEAPKEINREEPKNDSENTKNTTSNQNKEIEQNYQDSELLIALIRDRLKTSEKSTGDKELDQIISYMNATNIEIENLSLPYICFDPEYESKQLLETRKQPDLRPNQEKNQELKGRIDKFTGELIKQKTGIAETIGAIREIITQYPQVQDSELCQIVAEKAREYKFSPSQLFMFRSGISRYRYNNTKINNLREKFPSDRELYNQVFGYDISSGSNLEVIKGPVALEFSIDNIDDFAHAIGIGKGKKNGLSASEKNKLPTGSAFRVFKKNQELNNNIIVSFNYGDKIMQNIVSQHEHNHSLDNLFIPEEAYQKIDDEQIRLWSMQLKNNPESLRSIINEISQSQILTLEFLTSVRTEVLSYYLENRSKGKFSPRDISHYLKSPLYDYTKMAENYLFVDSIQIYQQLNSPELSDDLTRELREIEENSKNSDKGFWRNIFKSKKGKSKSSSNIFSELVIQNCRDNYNKRIDNCIKAIENLEEKGYSRTEINNLFYTEPTNRWLSLSRKIGSIREK